MTVMQTIHLFLEVSFGDQRLSTSFGVTRSNLHFYSYNYSKIIYDNPLQINVVHQGI